MLSLPLWGGGSLGESPERVGKKDQWLDPRALNSGYFDVSLSSANSFIHHLGCQVSKSCLSFIIGQDGRVISLILPSHPGSNFQKKYLAPSKLPHQKRISSSSSALCLMCKCLSLCTTPPHTMPLGGMGRPEG